MLVAAKQQTQRSKDAAHLRLHTTAIKPIEKSNRQIQRHGNTHTPRHRDVGKEQ